MPELVNVEADPVWAAESISEEIEKHAQFCRENPLTEDSVPLWTLMSGGMQITWAILLLERAMKQLLCFDGKDVYKNHDLSQLFAQLDNSTRTYVEKAFKAYVMLYPNANVKSITSMDDGRHVMPASRYATARKLLAGISSQERYIMWRYPEFYSEVSMDITNVHLILEIAIAVSNVLIEKVGLDKALGKYSIGRRIQASFMNAFCEKRDILIRQIDESGNDPFDVVPANEINSWQAECGDGAFFPAFVDFLFRKDAVDVYRHKGLDTILRGAFDDILSSGDSYVSQFLARVRQDDFNLNVLMML